MDLAAPRSMEEAQEIDRRGELKYDYFTNYVRIRTVFTYMIYYSSYRMNHTHGMILTVNIINMYKPV